MNDDTTLPPMNRFDRWVTESIARLLQFQRFVHTHVPDILDEPDADYFAALGEWVKAGCPVVPDDEGQPS